MQKNIEKKLKIKRWEKMNQEITKCGKQNINSEILNF